MTDYRQKLINMGDERFKLVYKKDVIVTLGEKSDDPNIVEYLKDVPIVDAVEVVRCKDCKYRNYEAPPGIYYCMAKGHGGHTINKNLMGYCSDGERDY